MTNALRQGNGNTLRTFQKLIELGLAFLEMKKTAARDAWAEIQPSLQRIVQIVVTEAATAGQGGHAV